MRGPSLYCSVIVAAIMAILGVLVLTATRVPPFSGDLTRVGGFSENEYGWTQSQRGFGRPLYHVVRTYGELLDTRSTIVVFGDSFSEPREDRVGTWLDFMNGHLNEDVTFFHYKYIEQIFDYMASPQFFDHPPKAVVLEAVNRNFVWRVAIPNCVSPETSPPQTPPGLAWSTGPEPIAIERRTTYHGIREALSVASYFLRSAAWKQVAGSEQTVESNLVRSDLFSSDASTRLLTYAADRGAMIATAPEIATTICTLRSLQARASANGRTTFLFVPTPDKSFAYRDYVTDRRFQIPPGYAALREVDGLGWIDTVALIDSLLRQGVMDVYLPDDTHFGSPAAKAVGEAAASVLSGRSMTAVVGN